MTKLTAILHDGTFDGDSAFYCPDHTGNDKYKKGTTLNQLSKKFWKIMVKELVSEEEDVQKDYPVKGAWIVDEKGMKVISVIWESDPGNDSATYACNRAAKRVAQIVAIKCLGKKAK